MLILEDLYFLFHNSLKAMLFGWESKSYLLTAFWCIQVYNVTACRAPLLCHLIRFHQITPWEWYLQTEIQNMISWYWSCDMKWSTIIWNTVPLELEPLNLTVSLRGRWAIRKSQYPVLCPSKLNNKAGFFKLLCQFAAALANETFWMA